MSWITIKELSMQLDCSEKTIRRKIKAGEFEVKEQQIGCGKPTILVFFDDNSKLDKLNQTGQTKLDNCNSKLDILNQTGQTKLDNCNSKLDKTGKSTINKEFDQLDTIGQSVNSKLDILNQTGQIKLDNDNSKLDKTVKNTMNKEFSQSHLTETPNQFPETPDRDTKIVNEFPESPDSNNEVNQTFLTTSQNAVEVISSHLPATPLPDLKPKRKDCPEKYIKLAMAKAALCDYVLNSTVKKQEAINLCIDFYSRGLIYTNYKSVLGKVSSRTLYRWIETYINNDKDFMSLAPGYDVTAKGRKVPEEIQDRILKILLHDNEIKIQSAVNRIVSYYRISNKELNCSIRTMTRWVEDWKNNNITVWTIARQGIKSFRDTINTSLARDWDLVNVGDVWISDGHTIEVMIIDPETGKPKKHEIIAWFDAASRMPIGASINLTENTQSIQLAFRNAALYTGYLPKAIIIDNGKAYNSKYYRGEMQDDEIEAEFTGLYGRLGIIVVNSAPYNARAKHLERWWLTLQEDCERYLSSFTGPNAMDKPANLSRNEKYVRSLHNRSAITIEQFKQIFEIWSLEIYGKRPHRGINNRLPLEMYIEGSKNIESSRMISPDHLNYMMLAINNKKVTKDGVRINRLDYWHPALVQYVGQNIKIRWDYWDIRSILCYDNTDVFICQAVKKELQHPLIQLSNDKPLAKAQLEKGLKEIRNVEKQARQATNEILRRVSNAGDTLVSNENFLNMITNDTPMMPEPPKKSKTLEELVYEADAINSTDHNEKTETKTLEDIIQNTKTQEDTKEINKEQSDFEKEARELAELYGIGK